jgi:serine/threonine protein kinase
VYAPILNAEVLLQEISQLFKIFTILGTPNEDVWPGVSNLPDYAPHFPQWHPQDLKQLLRGRLEPEGLDLLSRMLRFPPEERISAIEALHHPYFADLQEYQPGTRLPIA